MNHSKFSGLSALFATTVVALAGCGPATPSADAAPDVGSDSAVVMDAGDSGAGGEDAAQESSTTDVADVVDRDAAEDVLADALADVARSAPPHAECSAARTLAVGSTLRDERFDLVPRTTRCSMSNYQRLYYSVPLAAGQVVEVAASGRTDGINELPMCGGCPVSTGVVRQSVIIQNTTATPRNAIIEADADPFGTAFDLRATDVPAATNVTCAGARALSGSTSLPLERHPGEAMGAMFLVSDCRSFAFAQPVLFYRVAVRAGQTLTVRSSATNLSVFEGCAPTMCVARGDLSGRLTYTNSTAATRELILAADSSSVFSLDVTLAP